MADRNDMTAAQCPSPGAFSVDAVLILIFVGPSDPGPLTLLCHSSVQMAHAGGRLQVKCCIVGRKPIKVKHDPFFHSTFI